jgi:hypothetical protein
MIFFEGQITDAIKKILRIIAIIIIIGILLFIIYSFLTVKPETTVTTTQFTCIVHYDFIKNLTLQNNSIKYEIAKSSISRSLVIAVFNILNNQNYKTSYKNLSETYENYTYYIYSNNSIIAECD